MFFHSMASWRAAAACPWCTWPLNSGARIGVAEEVKRRGKGGLGGQKPALRRGLPTSTFPLRTTRA